MIEIQRTHSQLLDGANKAATPHDVVEWMGAMQAQDLAMAKWAVGVRLPHSSRQQVEADLAEGRILRLHILRPTWHYVSARDVRWMVQLSGTRIRPTYLSWGKQFEISDTDYRHSCEHIIRMLTGHHHLTKHEITERMAREGVPFAAAQVHYMLCMAEADGLLCSGREQDGKHTYALLDERVPPHPLPCREEALTLLAHKYFRSHSPATLEDFVWWSGLTVTEARQALQSIAGELETLPADDNRPLYRHHTCPDAPLAVDTVHLLPPYDELLISYKSRTYSLPPEHNRKAFTPHGVFFPVVCHNGRIIGNWQKNTRRDAVEIAITLFDNRRPKVNKKLLQQAIERYRDFGRIHL